MLWLFHRLGLIGRGNQVVSRPRLVDPAQILFLQQKRPLQNHLHLRSAFDVDISAAGEQRCQPGGGKPRSDSRNASRERMAGVNPAYNRDRGPVSLLAVRAQTEF
jgi:hypothetical protein